jgi:mannose/cellobiose epimerase-like protein (N-acyl-D-glucosamine 2-epimerase family)
MAKTFNDRIEFSKKWLKDDVYPLWFSKGIDSENGAFVEELSSEGSPVAKARRAMVQARQIYSLNEGVKLNVFSETKAKPAMEKAMRFLMQTYALPSGAFLHALNIDGSHHNDQVDLYTQAFILFGLGNSFEVLKKEEYRDAAFRLVNYLESERRSPNGGYSEILSDKVCYQSNPHMHLFEAVLFWLRIDSDPLWKKMATEIFELCRDKFMNNDAGAVCERFDSDWSPEKESGKFVWEPGHQYEWAWLLLQFEELTGEPTRPIAEKLFQRTERFGINPTTGFVYDEVWSDHTVKSKTSRFWPQGERIKAAVELGLKTNSIEKELYGKAADQGFDSLFKYFEGVMPGLWTDKILESGEATKANAKASSLYHIVNALSEYATKRPRLTDKV